MPNFSVDHPEPDNRFRDDQVLVMSPFLIAVNFGYYLFDVDVTIQHLSPNSVRVAMYDTDAWHVEKDTKVFTVTADEPILVAFVKTERGGKVLVVPA